MFRVEGLHFSEGKGEVVWMEEGNTGGRDWEEGREGKETVVN